MTCRAPPCARAVAVLAVAATWACTPPRVASTGAGDDPVGQDTGRPDTGLTDTGVNDSGGDVEDTGGEVIPGTDTGWPDLGVRYLDVGVSGYGGQVLCGSGHVLPFGSTSLEAFPEVKVLSLSVNLVVACGLDPLGVPHCAWTTFYEDHWYYYEAEPPGPFTQVVTSVASACGLTPAGEVQCWGEEDYWWWNTPVPTGTFVTLAAGGHVVCGIATDGSLACWGRLEEGYPDLPGGEFVALAVDQEVGCAIRTSGETVCWPFVESLVVENELEAPDVALVALDAASFYTCGLDAGGRVWCWGSGDWDRELGYLPPVAPDTTFRKISVGSWESCGITLDDELVCWDARDGSVVTHPEAACD